MSLTVFSVQFFKSYFTKIQILQILNLLLTKQINVLIRKNFKIKFLLLIYIISEKIPDWLDEFENQTFSILLDLSFNAIEELVRTVYFIQF